MPFLLHVMPIKIKWILNQAWPECLHAAAIAAGDGAAGTSKMVARKGRAKFLNKESLGYVDAGSVTMPKSDRSNVEVCA